MHTHTLARAARSAKVLVALGAIAVVSATACSGGGDNPQQNCLDTVAVTCDKLYSCNTGPALDQIKATYGATSADCQTKLHSSCQSAPTGTAQACPSGEVYDTTKAVQCLNDYKALTCDKLPSTPASCQGGFCKKV